MMFRLIFTPNQASREARRQDDAILRPHCRFDIPIDGRRSKIATGVGRGRARECLNEGFSDDDHSIDSAGDGCVRGGVRREVFLEFKKVTAS
jgi:hypothetical protein